MHACGAADCLGNQAMLLHCRLASFICGYEVFQIAVSSSYGVADFKENLLALYTKVSLRSQDCSWSLIKRL